MKLRSYFLDPFETEDFYFNIPHKIRKEKRECSEKAIHKLTSKHIQKGEELCTLAKVQEALIIKGVCGDNCHYLRNDFTELLEVNLAATDFILKIPLFPKQNPQRGITLTVDNAELHKNIDSYATPESVADFILGMSEWLPEYYAIDVRIHAEEMRKQTIRDLAVDLLKRNIGAILEEKGYEYIVSSSGITNKASLTITFSKVFQMTLEIDLMEDFLDQVKRVVESLPANEVCD